MCVRDKHRVLKGKEFYNLFLFFNNTRHGTDKHTLVKAISDDKQKKKVGRNIINIQVSLQGSPAASCSEEVVISSWGLANKRGLLSRIRAMSHSWQLTPHDTGSTVRLLIGFLQMHHSPKARDTSLHKISDVMFEAHTHTHFSTTETGSLTDTQVDFVPLWEAL